MLTPSPSTPSSRGREAHVGTLARLRVSVDSDRAATSSEHAVRSRILLSEDSLLALGLKSGQPCIVSWGSPALEENDEHHQHSVVATAWLSRSRSSIGGNGSTPVPRKSSSLKSPPPSGAASVAQVSAEIADCPSHVEVRALVSRPLPARRLVLEVGPLSQDTLAYIAYSLAGSVVSRGTRVGVRLAGALVVMQVLDVDPRGIAEITPDTTVLPTAAAASSSFAASASDLAVAPLAGVDAIFDELLRLARSALQSGSKGGGGALVYGPSGVGKTHLARHLAIAIQKLPGVTVVTVDPSTPDALLQIQTAIPGPTLLVIDDADVLCPSRSQTPSVASRHLVGALLALLDGNNRVFCLACAKSSEVVDSALSRPGRMDSLVELSVPDAKARAEILKAHLRRFPNSVGDVDSIAGKAHGFVAADLAGAVRMAAMSCVAQGSISQDDLQRAVSRTSPSALRQAVVEVPRVKWDDIGGMRAAKRVLRQAVELPLSNPEAFARLGVSPPSGVLLYGPPGCSKTLMAKAVATESDMNFIAVKGPELLSKWVGDSEKAVQETFRRARASAPCVVFFDEVDALAATRGAGDSHDGAGGSGGVEARVLSQLLLELDGVQARGRVVVLCATNRPDMLDPALLRPGRLDRLVYVPPPDAEARAAILRIHLRNVPVDFDLTLVDQNVNTEGFSGAEVASVAREAALAAMDRNADKVSLEDVQMAAKRVVPQITRDMIVFYETFTASHSSYRGTGKQ